VGWENLSNCQRCGTLVNSTFGKICPSCLRKIEEEYQACVDYLKENRMASIQELSEATGVAVKQIAQFIKEGRINIAEAANISYPCETCGTPIRSGRFCNKCEMRLQSQLYSEKERLRGDIGKAAQQGGHTYELNRIRKKI
jgi:flagellar operon protein (TIGR03826 family)